jgi:PAP2 superfamily
MKYSSLLLALCLLFGCNTYQRHTNHPAVQTMLDWYGFALRADRYTEGFKSPVAARAYAYTGIAAWEAARATTEMQNTQSLKQQFPDIAFPAPTPGVAYHLPSVLTGCYNHMFELMFLGNPRNIEQERKALFKRMTETNAAQAAPKTIEESLLFGRATAAAVFAWAATDSIGHQGHLHNYDITYAPPPGDSVWEPCRDFPTPSLLPHWGQTRPFTIKTEDYTAAPPIPYSEVPGSMMHKQALELFVINSPLSDENMHIAEFWSDDHPSLTFSSSGRWISISNQVIGQEHTDPEKALKTYLLTGIAISDALTTCWFSKYKYQLLRPETYVRRTMQPNWRPIMHTPPSPSYPSGHAQCASAAAEVLAYVWGDAFAFTDRSHEGRTEFSSAPRTYSSFRAMAEESAYSRIALGVHFRIDCEEGTRLGQEVGKAVIQKIMNQ